MKINCLSCGHKVDLDDVYDDYEGLVKCLCCGTMLEIKTDEGRLKRVITSAPYRNRPQAQENARRRHSLKTGAG